MRSRRRIAPIVVALAAGLAVGSCGQTTQRFQESALARWWRCHDSSRPFLAANSSPWVIEYSWTEGFGPGDVHLELRSDGATVFRVVPHHGEERSQRANATPENVAAIAAAVDRVGLLCLESQPRAGHRVVDLGTYRIAVESGEFTKELTVSTCNAVADPGAFEAVLNQIHQLAPLIGQELEWGPYGVATLPGACSGGASSN